MTETLVNSIEINKSKKGVTVLDVPSNLFINNLAAFFKEKNVFEKSELEITCVLLFISKT